MEKEEMELNLKEGLVIAIEPMINLGTRRIKQLSDGWTIITETKNIQHILNILL